MKFYYTYVLRCVLLNNKIETYIGYTNDLRKRYERHSKHKVIATKKYKHIELVYYEACRSKQDAILREKSLKSGFGRAYVKNRLKSYFESGISSPVE